MEISIQKKPAFTVAGVKMEAIDSSLCSEAWNKLFESSPQEKLKSMGNGQSYGMCYDVKDCKNINYMACFDVTDKKAAEEMNLQLAEIAENEYAVVKLKGAIPDSIHQGWKYLMEVFFPERGYKHSGAPDFEVYTEGCMSSPNYEMELWVPVVKQL